MHYKRIVFNAILFLGPGLLSVFAQESIAVSGGDASGSGGTSSYTLGQVAFITNSGTGGSEAQGVQHAFEISIVSGIEETNGISLRFSAYPNPVSEVLVLKTEGEVQVKYDASIYDINGDLIMHIKTEGIETSIDMKNLLPATYFLKVSNYNKEVKTFKIIKNQ
jgi:hypothetical protein